MRFDTDHLLTLGMALTTDKRAMERRVRGVFARKRSAKGALALSAVLALALGFAAFTTACQPGQAIASDSNAVSGGNAFVSSGNALVLGGNALVSGGNAEGTAYQFTKPQAMERLAQTLERARKFPVPYMEDIGFTERGTWEILTSPDDAERLNAANRFLETANAIFSTKYTQSDLAATYYTDKTGFRSDVWRFDSKDGKLSGALDAKSLAFLSADCLNEPADALHASMANGGKVDVGDTVKRVATLLGGSVIGSDSRSGFSSKDATNGWMIKRDLLVSLNDGRYFAICIFGDEKLTPTTVCVYPDEDCGNENVFWRADLEQTEGASKLLYPQDFREGTPGADDMTEAQAIDFYNKLISLAGRSGLAENAKSEEPKATFYVDYSGARENYWHVEDDFISFDLTSKTGHMLNLSANGTLGKKMGLTGIPYENMGGDAYLKATHELFTGLFGKDAVQLMAVNAVYDDHYCTIDPFMTDGSSYEVMYQDGLIVDSTFLSSTDPSRWTSVPDWLKKWAKTDAKTGAITVEGMESGNDRYVPNWLADWVYVNNETGEIYAMEW